MVGDMMKRVMVRFGVRDRIREAVRVRFLDEKVLVGVQ